MRWTIEERKLSELARRYLAEGYEVFTQLEGYPKPEKYGKYRPDLVAQKGNETIIIEVKSSTSGKERLDAIDQLASYASEMEGVRFDLVVTNPRTTKKELQSRDSQVLKELRARLLHTLNVTAESQPAIFLATCGLLLEHLLATLAAESEPQEARPRNPVELAKHLSRKGVISKSTREFVLEIWPLRNAAVHGPMKPIPRSRLKTIRRKILSLVRNYGWREYKLIKD